MESYDWYTKEASKNFLSPLIQNFLYGIQLAKKNSLKPIENTVVYILNVLKEYVLYFNDQKWDYVLNRIYLPENEEDRIKYEIYLNLLNISDKKLSLFDSYQFTISKFKGMFPQ